LLSVTGRSVGRSSGLGGGMTDGAFEREAGEWDLGGEPEAVLRALVHHAMESTRRRELPADLASDIAQEVFRRLWAAARSTGEKPTRAKALELVEQSASAERQRRRRERTRLARGPPLPVSRIRPVCVRLGLLDQFADSPREYLAALHAVAVLAAYSKTVLRNDQLRLFGLVHVTGGSDKRILAQLGGTVTRSALQKRRRRLERRIEKQVAILLEREMPAADWERIALLFAPGSAGRNIEKVGSAEWRRVSGVLVRAIRRVIHKNPGLAASSTTGDDFDSEDESDWVGR